jgi:hypothetical protein
VELANSAILEPADREHNISPKSCGVYLNWCNSLIFDDQSVSFLQPVNPESLKRG